MGVRECPHISGLTDFAEVGSQPGSMIAAIKALIIHRTHPLAAALRIK
jgi:hypothetical protein